MRVCHQTAVLSVVAMVAMLTLSPLATEAKPRVKRTTTADGNYTCGSALPYGHMFDCEGNIVITHYDIVKNYFKTCIDSQTYCKQYADDGYCNFPDFHKVCIHTCEHCEENSVEGVLPESVIEKFIVKEMEAVASDIQSYEGTTEES